MNDDQEMGLKELEKELQDAVTDGGWYVEQCARDYETRHCIWPGQSANGKKSSEDLGKEAFPWDGASDVRIRLADMVCNDNARILRMAMKRGMLQASPVESTDAPKATAVTTFMKVLFGKRMAQNIRREIPLLANWQEAYSLSVLAITYDQELRIKKRPLTLQELEAAVNQLTSGNRIARLWQAGSLTGQEAGVRANTAQIGMTGAQGYIAIDPYQRALQSNIPIASQGASANLTSSGFGQTLGYVSDLQNSNFNADWTDYMSKMNRYYAGRYGGMGAAGGGGPSAGGVMAGVGMGALSGAATGSVAGPYGAAAGAVVGGVLGGVSASQGSGSSGGGMLG